MNFDQAVVAHMGWKIRIKNFIYNGEKLDPVAVSQDNACELGQWIYAEAAKLDHLPEFHKVKKLHAEFHQVAAEVIKQAARLSPDEAVQLLSFGSDFAKASAACVNAIISLQDCVQANEEVAKAR